VSRDGDERREKQSTLYEILGAGIEAFKNYLNLGWNFNSMKESLAKDIAEITIDLLNIIYLENDERSNKIKQTCAILLFALAMPNENKYEILIMSDDFPIYRAFVKTSSLGDVYRI
jgi:hypothetical protein